MESIESIEQLARSGFGLMRLEHLKSWNGEETWTGNWYGLDKTAEVTKASEETKLWKSFFKQQKRAVLHVDS